MMTGVEAWLDSLPHQSHPEICGNFRVDCILANNGVGADHGSIDMSHTTELYNSRDKLFDKHGKAVGAIIEVDSGSGQDAALSLVGSVEWIALRCTGSWTMIPVENLIAACDGTG